MGSTRFPGKVLKPILGKPMLWHIVRRVRSARSIDEVVVAVPDTATDEELRQFCRDQSISFFAGSEGDVLDRFYGAAKRFAGDPVLRITADCPLVDPQVIECLLAMYRKGEHDHVGVVAGAGAVGVTSGNFPDGLDAECFSFAALEEAWTSAEDSRDREHVTRYIWRQRDKFRCGQLFADSSFPDVRLTVDHPKDFELTGKIYEALGRQNKIFLLPETIAFLEKNPELLDLNRHLRQVQNYESVLTD
jgi:spore coat polysaccharide biosynthesis protein SpsF